MKGKTGKWLLLVAAVLTIVLSVSPALAAEEAPTPIFSTSKTKINPLYASGDAPTVSYTTGSPMTYVAYTLEDAAGYLRSAMAERETEFVIAFPVELESDLDDKTALGEEVLRYEELLFQLAVEHGTSGRLGDYLLYSQFLRMVEIAVAQEDDITVMAIMYQILYHDTAKQALETETAAKELLDSLNLRHLSDYEKVCAVYDWLCANVTYQEAITEEFGVLYSAYGALVNRVSVCQGYALAMYRLLREVGVDCRIISGTGAEGPHAWNIVRIGDRYYNVDATWDAARYQAGQAYAWFLTSDANFPDHERDPMYMSESFYAAHPMSPENYAPSVLASGTCGDNLTWTLMDERSFFIYGTGPMYDFEIGKQPWAEYREKIGRVYIEEGVTSIGKLAFSSCRYMEDVRIPESVQTIGMLAFDNCEGIRELVIPEGVVSIGDYAFGYCYDMRNVSLPESLTSIGRSAFNQCSGLEKIDLPAGLTSLGQFAFSSCTSLRTASIPASLEVISDHAFSFCGSLVSVEIPEGITAIGASAFRLCESLQSAALPESLTDIGNGAFQECRKLTSVEIPAGVTNIGWSAFSACKALSQVTIPAGITSLPNNVFRNCGLTSITVPENVTSIGDHVFEDCKNLTSVTLTDSITSIGISAFSGCTGITDFTFPKGITSISESMLAGTGLVNLVIPEHITEIGNSAFSGCQSLVNITIPESVTSIGDSAFSDCIGITDFTFPKSITKISSGMLAGTGLVSVVIPDHITEIGNSAFSHCRFLASVTVPGSVTGIGDWAFGDCPVLEELRFLGDAPVFGNIAFFNSDITAYYPKDNETWTSVVYDNYGGQVTWVAEETTHEEEPFFTFTGTSVSLGESLDFHFFLSGDDVTNTDYAVITRTYADGREDHVVTVPYSQWDALGEKLYITYPGVAAKEMNDLISVVVYDKDGNAISQLYTDSVQKYAMRLKRSLTIDGALQILLVNMLNYGTEAQLYFGYDTEHLANAELTYHDQLDASKDYLVEDHLKCSEGRAATALTLKSRLSLDLYFKNSVIGTDYANLYATVTYTDHYGKEVAYRVEGEDFVAAEGDRGYVSVTGLAIADYRQLVTCTVYDSEDNVLAWTTDSVEGYIARMEDKIPAIVGALAKLGNTAWYCFHGYIGDPLETPKVIR